MLGPKEIPHIVSGIKKTIRYAKETSAKLTQSLESIDEVKEIKNELDSFKTIIDLDGNPQRAYDVDEARKDIEISKSPKE